MANLTDRQIALKTYIHIKSLAENVKVSQRDIYENVSGYEWNDNPKVHDHCVAIWSDIEAINDNTSKNKLSGYILSKNYVYWIGTEEETKAYLSELKKRMLPSLKRYWRLKKYIDHNGEFDLFSETFRELFKEIENEEE